MRQLELFPLPSRQQQPMSTQVEPWGFPVEVFYDFDEGDAPTLTSPGTEPFCVILEAHVGGVDIYEMLHEHQILRLEEAVLRAMGVR